MNEARAVLTSFMVYLIVDWLEAVRGSSQRRHLWVQWGGGSLSGSSMSGSFCLGGATFSIYKNCFYNQRKLRN